MIWDQVWIKWIDILNSASALANNLVRDWKWENRTGWHKKLFVLMMASPFLQNDKVGKDAGSPQIDKGCSLSFRPPSRLPRMEPSQWWQRKAQHVLMHVLNSAVSWIQTSIDSFINLEKLNACQLSCMYSHTLEHHSNVLYERGLVLFLVKKQVPNSERVILPTCGLDYLTDKIVPTRKS